MLGRPSMGRLVVVLGAVWLLGGCAAGEPTLAEWFGAAAPTATPTPAPETDVLYAGEAGLAMHFLPSGSSQIVGRLALHERVTRLDLQRGYARVVADNGLEGWVDNARLLWRLPLAATPTPAPAP